MKTISRFCWLSVLVSLASCVSTQNVPLPQAEAARLRGASLATTQRNAPDFAAMVASKAALGSLGVVGGALGASAMISSGNKIVRTNGVEDPAEQMSRELAAALASGRGAKVVSRSATKVTDESPQAIAKQNAGADFVLDVRTINWSFCYFPANWSHYRVIYSARLRLIDVKTGKVIAEGFHARVPGKTDAAPNYDQLLASNAAVLKRELQIAAAECTAHFKKSVLGL